MWCRWRSGYQVQISLSKQQTRTRRCCGRPQRHSSARRLPMATRLLMMRHHVACSLAWELEDWQRRALKDWLTISGRLFQMLESWPGNPFSGGTQCVIFTAMLSSNAFRARLEGLGEAHLRQCVSQVHCGAFCIAAFTESCNAGVVTRPRLVRIAAVQVRGAWAAAQKPGASHAAPAPW